MDHQAQRTGTTQLEHPLIRVDSQQVLILRVRARLLHIKVHILKVLATEQASQRPTQHARLLLTHRLRRDLHIKQVSPPLTRVVSHIPVLVRQGRQPILQIRQTLTSRARLVQVDSHQVLIQRPKLVLSPARKRVLTQPRRLVLPMLARIAVQTPVPIHQDNRVAATKVGSPVVSLPAATKVAPHLDRQEVVILVVRRVARYHRLVLLTRLPSRRARIQQQSQ